MDKFAHLQAVETGMTKMAWDWQSLADKFSQWYSNKDNQKLLWTATGGLGGAGLGGLLGGRWGAVLGGLLGAGGTGAYQYRDDIGNWWDKRKQDAQIANVKKLTEGLPDAQAMDERIRNRKARAAVPADEAAMRNTQRKLRTSDEQQGLL